MGKFAAAIVFGILVGSAITDFRQNIVDRCHIPYAVPGRMPAWCPARTAQIKIED
jgi:hypothetical protein